jgi:hypothetical protein
MAREELDLDADWTVIPDRTGLRRMQRKRARTPAWRLRATDAAQAFGGVISRHALRELDVDRDRVAREIDAGRWRAHGQQTVAVHTARLRGSALWWRAVWETGTRVAALDGVTALQAAGLQHFTDDRVHVSVVHRADVPSDRGATVHKIARRVPGELAGWGVPRASSGPSNSG